MNAHAQYEIREYDSYTVAYTDMGAGGADAVGMESGGGGDSPVLGSPAMTGGAFNTLASYLFGAFRVSWISRRRWRELCLPCYPHPAPPPPQPNPNTKHHHQGTTTRASPWP